MKRLTLVALSLTVIAIALLMVSKPRAQELPPQGLTDIGHSHTLIGTLDGCRLWKVNYWGTDIFMARCPSGTADTQWAVECGENCTERVQTVGTNKQE